MSEKRVYFYVDMDAFFASVEEAEHPELKDIPMAVAGRSNSGGVISCANYTARKFGVKSAIPVFKAKQICPSLTIVNGSMELYRSYSEKVMNILSGFSPDFYQMSIDEAWLDMTGMGRIYSSVKECALTIQNSIYKELSISSSIGIAWDLVVAKMASDYKKPMGITVVPLGQEESFIDTAGIDKLWGVGKYTHALLKERGIDSISRLRAHKKEYLQDLLGDSRGEYVYDLVRGRAGEKKADMDKKRKSHSISMERTLDEPISDIKKISKLIYEYSFNLFSQCIDEQIFPRTVSIKIKYTYDKFVSASYTCVSSHFFNSDQLSRSAFELFEKKHIGESVRLIGVEVSNFISDRESSTLLEFMDDDSKLVKLSQLDILSNKLAKNGIDIKRGSIYNFS